jgi:general secretion pathway protein A
MFLRHFNLSEQPFGVTPNPRFLYASSTHREALAALVYGLESGLGFVSLVARPGMGKTTLLFEVLRRLNETARTVFLFQTISTPVDLFRALLIDLGVENPQGTLVDHQTQLNQMLAKESVSGKRLVIVIDEAQNLDDSVLEAVRMLSNFETGNRKLMHIVLSGQLQLAERLAGRQLEQLRQRISIFAHLKPLSRTETAEYIQHRLRTAGWEKQTLLFTPPAMALIADQSQGIPRNINRLCFNALSIACAMRKTVVDSDIVAEAASDLDLSAILAPDDSCSNDVLPPASAQPQPAPVIAIQSQPLPQLAVSSASIPAAPAILAASEPVEAAPQLVEPEAIEPLVLQQRLTVVEAAPQPPAIALVESKPKPAPAVRRKPPRTWPPRGLAHALSGSLAELSEEWEEPESSHPAASDEFSLCGA